jgi:hypothetical protein
LDGLALSLGCILLRRLNNSKEKSKNKKYISPHQKKEEKMRTQGKKGDTIDCV